MLLDEMTLRINQYASNVNMTTDHLFLLALFHDIHFQQDYVNSSLGGEKKCQSVGPMRCGSTVLEGQCPAGVVPPWLLICLSLCQLINHLGEAKTS